MKTAFLGAALALTALPVGTAQAAKIVDVTGLFKIDSVLINCQPSGPFCNGTTWYSYSYHTLSFDLDMMAVDELVTKYGGQPHYNYSITVKKIRDDLLTATDSSLSHNYKLEGQVGDYVGTGKAFQFSYVGNAVPEPSTWALMIMGFGLVGYSLRRKTALRFV